MQPAPCSPTPRLPLPVRPRRRHSRSSSDKDGYYRLLELPPGEYELTAERQGFARFVRPGIVARAGLNLSVDIDLAVGTRAETTTVRAETPMLESSSAAQAINIDGELQRQVPLSDPPRLGGLAAPRPRCRRHDAAGQQQSLLLPARG